jgi:hypothetical protein
MDWLNPEWLKPFAALAEYWKEIIGAAVVIVGAIFAFIKWGWTLVSDVLSKFAQARQRQKKPPLRFVLNEQASFWTPAGTQEGTHVRGFWYVTNTSVRNVVLLKARLRNRQAHFFHVHAYEQSDVPSGGALIPAHHRVQMTADLSFLTVICTPREDLVADVIFTDNYGEEHRIRSVRFPYRGS